MKNGLGLEIKVFVLKKSLDLGLGLDKKSRYFQDLDE